MACRLGRHRAPGVARGRVGDAGPGISRESQFDVLDALEIRSGGGSYGTSGNYGSQQQQGSPRGAPHRGAPQGGEWGLRGRRGNCVYIVVDPNCAAVLPPPPPRSPKRSRAKREPVIVPAARPCRHATRYMPPVPLRRPFFFANLELDLSSRRWRRMDLDLGQCPGPLSGALVDRMIHIESKYRALPKMGLK